MGSRSRVATNPRAALFPPRLQSPLAFLVYFHLASVQRLLQVVARQHQQIMGRTLLPVFDSAFLNLRCYQGVKRTR